jgi:hypothetical protein
LAPTPPPATPPRKIWSGTGDIGLNGANGNSEVLSLRTTWTAQRRTATNLFISDFLYAFSRQDGTVQQQQALFNARDEILFPGQPCSLFSATQVEYDELRSYRFRVGQYAGAGLAVIDTKPLLFRLRMGAGAQRELGVDGERDRWVPEAVFGYDYRHRLDDRNALVSVVDYYPRLDDWSQFRVRARLAYEIVIEPKTGAVLRIGVQDRYDSHPGREAVRNDINYFTTLGFRF